jgi:hypothetical protein
MTVLEAFPCHVGRVRITLGHPIRLGLYPSMVVRTLTVVVAVGPLFGRKLPFAFQNEYQPEDFG